jgi:hypothetical protein
MKKIFLVLILFFNAFSTVWYVDPAATGAGNGTSWTDAWATLQAAATAVNTAGDVVYCRGTETFEDTLKFNNNGNTTGYISFIGVNSSGVNDGTSYKIDNNDGTDIGMYINAQYLYFENIYQCNSAYDGLRFNGANGYNVFNHCEWSSNEIHWAITGTGSETNFYYRCVASNNLDGWYRTKGSIFFCRTDTNTSVGFEFTGSTHSMLYGCATYRNGDFGIRYINHCGVVIGCISNGAGFVGNGDGFNNMPSSGGFYLGNISTSNDVYGFNFGAQVDHGYIDYSISVNNTTGDTNGFVGIIDGGNNLFGTGTPGYIDSANGNFNRDSTASLRRVPIFTFSNKDTDTALYYFSAGTAPTDTTKAFSVSNANDTSTYACSTATFYITVSGEVGTPVYVWQDSTSLHTWQNIANSDNDTLTTDTLTINDNGNKYRCVYSDDNNTDTSGSGTVTVTYECATIDGEPVADSVFIGEIDTFTITTTSVCSVSVQWQENSSGWANISGATNLSYITDAAIYADSGLYFRAIISTPSTACDTSDSALFSVFYRPATVTVQPVDTTAEELDGAAFFVNATGDSLTYQWQIYIDDWADTTGETESTFLLTNLDTSQNGDSVRVIVSNVQSVDTSASALLTVTSYPAPEITAGTPANDIGCVNKTVSIQPTVNTVKGMSYQWQDSTADWADIDGETNLIYTTPALQVNDSLYYRIITTNEYGADTSRAVLITSRICVDQNMHSTIFRLRRYLSRAFKKAPFKD